MNKFRNYIYYSICEGSLDYSKTTKAKDHQLFCDIIRTALLNNNYISKKDKAAIIWITNYIKRIYQINDTEIATYITNFFIEKKYLELQDTVILLSEHFKNSLL